MVHMHREERFMDISSVTSTSYQSASDSDPMAKMKQLFQNLGSALDSGNLSDAKNALAQIQKSAPANSSDGNNPISAKVEKLSKAIDSGDLKAAQEAYADIKKTMSQGPTNQARAGGPGGPGGASPGGAKQSSGANGASSKKEYDKKDLNKDGVVSAEEEIVYDLKNPGEVKKSSTVVIKDSGPLIDTTV
jgi:hypothetical protein